MGKVRQRFQHIVDSSYDDIWTYASYLTGGAAETEDIAHEAYLLAFDRLAKDTEFTGDPRMWLRGTVRNLVHEHWRRKLKHAPQLADKLQTLADDAEDAATAMERSESTLALSSCLERLSQDERQLVNRVYDEGKAINEIAGELSLKPATLRVRLFRVRDGLRACVEKRLAGEVA